MATTHRLDRLAEKYGQRCFEVPVGFKNISAKMLETSAIIGGESSGGIAVQGRTNGKDGIFAASLLVEIVAATNLSLSELSQRIDRELGSTYMEERDYRFSSQERSALEKILFEERKVPDLPFPIDHVSYMDGCKLYFQNGGWMIARFSGTEPLLRIFCEMENRDDAVLATDIMEKMLNLNRQ